jgi:hypothetical protein
MKTKVKSHTRKLKGRRVRVKPHIRKTRRRRPQPLIITWETLEKVERAKEAGIPEEKAWEAAKKEQERTQRKRMNFGMAQWQLKPEYRRTRRAGTLSRIEAYPVTDEKGRSAVITKMTKIKRWPKIRTDPLSVPEGTPMTREALDPIVASRIKELRAPSRFELEKAIGDLEDWHLTRQEAGTAIDKPGGTKWKSLKPLPVKKK